MRFMEAFRPKRQQVEKDFHVLDDPSGESWEDFTRRVSFEVWGHSDREVARAHKQLLKRGVIKAEKLG